VIIARQLKSEATYAEEDKDFEARIAFFQIGFVEVF
jgi:hypothetical protein